MLVCAATVLNTVETAVAAVLNRQQATVILPAARSDTVTQQWRHEPFSVVTWRKCAGARRHQRARHFKRKYCGCHRDTASELDLNQTS